MKTRKTPAVQGAAAFGKGIAVLQLIADFHEPPTINQVMDACDLTRPTLYRLLKALESEGMVECSPSRRYKLGPRLIQFASRAFEQNDIARMAEPEMSLLVQVTKETCHLAVRCGMEMVYISRKNSPQAPQFNSAVGFRISMHASAIGKSVMAHLPAAERDDAIDAIDFVKLTPHTITDRDHFRQQLDQIYERGYATSEQEADLEVHCFGAAIFNRQQVPVGGISVSVPLYRFCEDHNRYVQPLLAACQRISEGLKAI